MGWSRHDRKRRNHERLQRQFGALTGGERIITLMTVLPVSHGPGRQLAGSAAGAPFLDPQVALQDAAGRFPREPTTVVLSEFSLSATDIHPVTGQPSTVLARYDLSEVAGLHAPNPGTSALLTFVDGGSVTLRGIAGVAKHTRQFYTEVADYLAS